MTNKTLREKAIDYWKILKEIELDKEGIKDSEKQSRLEPSNATIKMVEFIISENKVINDNEDIELARQSGYNEASYIFKKKVEELREKLWINDDEVSENQFLMKESLLKEIIDKIFGDLK